MSNVTQIRTPHKARSDDKVVRLPVALKRGRKVSTGPCAQIKAFPQLKMLRAKATVAMQDWKTATTDLEIRAAMARFCELLHQVEELEAATQQ